MSQKSLEYGTVTELDARAQARQLAVAGMEDARIKLEKDPFFPPSRGFGQTSFTYTETLQDPENGRTVGRYTVTIDVNFKTEPFRIVRIKSTGRVGEEALEDIASYSIYGELDVAGRDRAAPQQDNPRLFKFIVWREQDSEQPLEPVIPE